MKHYKIAIVGGGPAGMMAAISAADLTKDIVIIEHKDRVGCKILSTGNGKCNLTNRNMNASCYRSDSHSEFYSVIERFDTNALISFFEGLGLYVTERNGYIYPASEQAASVLDTLRFELSHRKIDVLTDCSIARLSRAGFPSQKCGSSLPSETAEGNKGIQIENTEFRNQNTEFRLQLSDHTEILSDRLIICCGGKAAPKTGSDGSGYEIARTFGHTVIHPVPALTKLKCKGDFWPSVSGVRAKAEISVSDHSENYWKEFGELQFTDNGISGIPVFNASRIVKRLLEQKTEFCVTINFDSKYSREETTDRIHHIFRRNPDLDAVAALNGILPKKLAELILKQSGLKSKAICRAVTEQLMDRIVSLLRNFRVSPYDTADFSQAQVCAGGVDLREIDLNLMESNLVKGLYFAGEILDVDGICGGYNLQWAFSSGRLAGRAAAESLR